MIRALVVEDEYFVRKGLVSTMPWGEFGIRIEGEASNGEKALDWLEAHPADLLITDLSMPVMNGFDLIRKAKERFPRLPIIVLTCHEDFKYIQEVLRLGALDYIVKTELEQGNMEESLRRIVGRLHGAKESGSREQIPSRPEWTAEQERLLQKHMMRWLPLTWAVKEEEFSRLREELVSLNPPIAKLQKTTHYWMVEWNRTLEAPFLPDWLNRSEEIRSWPDWEAFMNELRVRLRRHLLAASYPLDVTLRILEAADWVKTNLDARITQIFMARRLNMSRGYFSRCFLDVVGRSFTEYMKDLRIRRAKELLLSTAKPIAEIAEECGFLDHRYFSRQFREETGILPSEFRHSGP